MFKSREIRWFYSTELKAVEKWFMDNGHTFENAIPRTDYYLPLKNQDDIGIKLREGNVEIKQRISRSKTENITRMSEGNFENYIKWSFSSAEKDGLFQEIIEGEKYNWLGVRKERIGYKLKENQNGSIIRVKLDDYPEFGCQVEYTRIKIMNEIWYTLCLEWFGEKEIEFDLSVLDNMLGDFKLQAANSMGYAEFLKKFFR
ncbi:hypothetical protein ML462_09045 [Gramella lutea]|uniref:Uncharacterized protein n=1 Tax=Christiangramia lutea TaxID=1607951 RepID=A0A9X1V3D3_9FLAO|nr:hypothetical protein [Christiangramia lutea]MCH4823321.1 hypothetical protein [Christiangramia lutea]